MIGMGSGGSPWSCRSCRGMVASAAVAFSFAVAGGPGLAAGLTGNEQLDLRNAIGAGMHSFYSGDFVRAYEDLTAAVEAGTADPLAYYFRGLTALRLGRTDEAEADFSKGAEKEAADGGVRRVSRTLERVQGVDRLTLERYRARARMAGLHRDRAAAGRRYSEIEEAQPEVLRRRRPESVRPELMAPSRGSAAAPEDGVEEVPAPPAAGRRPAKPPAAPKRPATEADDDPFADDPADRPARSDGAGMGRRRAASENAAAQADAQDEEMSAEVDGEADDRDVQDEVNSVSGQ